MFDLSNLSDVEFEELCQDVMQVKLDLELERYAKGKDGGIDIADSAVKAQVIIQAKHYARSTVSHLLSSLRKEVEKVKEKNPKRYFVFTSLSLSREKKKEILALFPDYMADLSHVVAKEDIDAFLAEVVNHEIVKKHYKLWLCGSNVLSLIQNQDVFIDCDELMRDIEKIVPFFVETGSYDEAKHKLDKEKIVILVGAPGVGKTVLSKMLLLDYASKGYVVRFTSTNEISDIKNILSRDVEKKEIILLDDFLGQHYLKLEEKKPNELKSLLAFVGQHSNKRIILNSRIAILNEARQRFYHFAELMEQHEKQKYLVNMDKESILDKAKILYNHIYFNELPSEYFSALKEKKIYFDLVKHRNYNPRIVEYVTKKRNYERQQPEKYGEYVKAQFNNPAEVWADEFNNRMEPIDRMLMNTLYSLTDSTVETPKLEEEFNARLMIEKEDTSRNRFEEVLRRLGESVIKITNKGISVLNPSVNDYLRSSTEINEPEQIKIVRSMVYVDQMIKFAKSLNARKAVCDRLISMDFVEMKSIERTPYFYYLDFFVKNFMIFMN